MICQLKHLLATTLIAAPLLTNAAPHLLPALTGTWSSLSTPFGHGTKKIDLYLEADGTGMLIGSTTSRHTNAGADKALAPDAILGMRISATLDGDILTTRPSAPTGGNVRAVADMTLKCKYDAPGSTLQCTDPQGVTINLQRSSASMTADVAQILAIMQSHQTH